MNKTPEIDHPLKCIGNVEWRRQQIPEEQESEYLIALEIGLMALQEKIDPSSVFGSIYWKSKFKDEENPLRGAARKFLNWWKEIPDHWSKEPLTPLKTPNKQDIKTLFIESGSWVMKLLIGKEAFYSCVASANKKKNITSGDLVEMVPEKADINRIELVDFLEKIYETQQKLVEKSCYTMGVLWRNDANTWLNELMELCPDFSHSAFDIEELILDHPYYNLSDASKSRVVALAHWRYLSLYLRLNFSEKMKKVFFTPCLDAPPFWNGTKTLQEDIKRELDQNLEFILKQHHLEKYDSSNYEDMVSRILLKTLFLKKGKLLWKKFGLGEAPDFEKMDGWQTLPEQEASRKLSKTIQQKNTPVEKSLEQPPKKSQLTKADIISFAEESLPEDEMHRIDRALFYTKNSSIRRYAYDLIHMHQSDCRNPLKLYAFSKAFQKNPKKLPKISIKNMEDDTLMFISAPSINSTHPVKNERIALQQQKHISVKINSQEPGFIFAYWENADGSIKAVKPEWSMSVNNWNLKGTKGKPVHLTEEEFWARLYIVCFPNEFPVENSMLESAEGFIEILKRVEEESNAWVQSFILLGN